MEMRSGCPLFLRGRHNPVIVDRKVVRPSYSEYSLRNGLPLANDGEDVASVDHSHGGVPRSGKVAGFVGGAEVVLVCDQQVDRLAADVIEVSWVAGFNPFARLQDLAKEFGI